MKTDLQRTSRIIKLCLAHCLCLTLFVLGLGQVIMLWDSIARWESIALLATMSLGIVVWAVSMVHLVRFILCSQVEAPVPERAIPEQVAQAPADKPSSADDRNERLFAHLYTQINDIEQMALQVDIIALNTAIDSARSDENFQSVNQLTEQIRLYVKHMSETTAHLKSLLTAQGNDET